LQSLISIVTPTYNRAYLLTEAIDSVLAQTYPHWEMIIVDDGSTDGTAAIVEAATAKDHRISYYYQENAGQSSARQHALSVARGEFIAFLDSDNRWLPERLQKGLDALARNPNCAVSYGDCYILDEDGKRISDRNMRRYSGFITEQLVKDNCVSFNTSLTRREAIDSVGGFDPNVEVADDYDLWLRISVAHEFVYIPEYLAEYRVMTKQISSNKMRRYKSNTVILERFFRANPQLLNTGLHRRGMGGFYLRWSQYFDLAGEHKEAWRLLLKSLQVNPSNPAVLKKMVKYLLAR